MIGDSGAVVGNRSAGWEDEMVSLEAQLNTSVRMQIESTREGIKRLGESQDRLRAIGSSLGRVTSLCQQSEKLIDNYPVIRQVSKTCQHFRLVRAVYDRFAHLDETVTRTETLLQQDIEAGTSENVLLVWRYLRGLEAFRTQTLNLMKDAPQAVTYTLRRYFKKLDDLSTEFDSFFWALPRDFYLKAVGGEQAVLTRWALVLSRMERSCRTRFIAILEEWIGNKFRLAAESFPKHPCTDVDGTTTAIQWWMGDLTALRDGLVPCFPADMALLDTLALIFHRNVANVIARCLEEPKGGPALEAGDIQVLLRWTRDYHMAMTNTTGLSRVELEPPLLSESQEASLVSRYLEVARAKVAEWIGNVFEAERQALTQRTREPEIDAGNCYLSPASVDLIQILRQHIQTASEAGQGRLVLEVIADSARTVLAFQERLGRVLVEETGKYMASPDTAPPHLEAYLLMAGNTGLRWATSLQSEIVAGLDALVAPEYMPAAAKHFKTIADGFIGLAKIASECLTKNILATIRAPATHTLFTAEGWYEQAPAARIQLITATFADFFSDYKEHSEDFLFGKLVADVLEGFLIEYLQQLRARSTKIKPVEALALFEADCHSLVDFFTDHRDARRVQKSVDPVQKFGSLVSSSPKMIYLEFFAFWKVYPDLPMQLLEEVLMRREDLDKHMVRDIMDTCRRKTQEERPADIQQPSLFAKLKF